MIIPGYGIGTGADFSTAGGFSNYFSRPSFQDKAVNTYFAEHDPGYKSYKFNGVDFENFVNDIGANGGVYNRIGRGYPDVSANGLNFPIIYDGDKIREGGTSQAAPIWGSVITLINEKRTEAGKGPVGFVHPVLYEYVYRCAKGV
jgi:tripeptidyl-peptidase-1